MIDYVVTRLVVGGLDTNCYILKHRASRAAAVIDPGGDLLVIKNALFEQEASLRLILLTHGHIDHILALEDLRTPNTIVCIHKDDAHMLVERDLFTSMVPHDPRPMRPAEFQFERDGKYKVDPFEFYGIHTPGHPPGAVCYIFEDCLFTGDTLFRGSIGTTMFGGSDREMHDTLEALYRYPGDYGIYPGHGESTSLSDEKRDNPFFGPFRGD